MFPEIDKEKTGDRIRFFMEIRGLTVKDVCKALSLGCVQAVYKWMDGVNLPSLDNIYCLSILFQVPIDAMVCGKATSERTEHYAGLERFYTDDTTGMERAFFESAYFEEMARNQEGR